MSREDRPASSVLARVKCRRPYKRKGSPTDETLPENGPVPVPNLSSTAVAAMNEEQRITACKTGLERIYAMLRSSPHDWRNFISLGRSVIAHIDATTFMEKASRTTEQAWMIAGLQRLALSDAESGGVPDVAAWCSRQWLAIFQRDQTNVAALRGIGQAWLLRAQPTLLRIQRTDSSSSSGGSARSGSGSATARSQSSHTTGSSVERRRQADAAAKEAERKAGTADYVEARGFLQPAAEYLDRAVAAASSQRILSGDLLATVSYNHPCLLLQLLTRSARLQKHTCLSVTPPVHGSTSDYSEGRCSYYEQLPRSRDTA